MPECTDSGYTVTTNLVHTTVLIPPTLRPVRGHGHSGVTVHSRTMSPRLDPEGHRVAPFTTTLIPPGGSTCQGTFLEGPPSGLWGCLQARGVITASVTITATATVIIMGRHHPTNHWIEVAHFTETEVRDVPAMTELRATFTENTGEVAVTLVLPPS